ncbi:hypothetical protein [Streptomyces sp. JB150]|uniref:hypothetical protein n=1 Tax=Streptomyces sp. JB150 TaxID=2714844 RepID=UPI00140DD023|nr:hypothetical protein [Streptomyces sp. JB150]QIJ61427.1 hypothetical protein G7Z13_04795 [Streptomyces sp. JB150]
MLADDDPRLSPLWRGRRGPFREFQAALAGLAGAYDLRDGRSSDPASRISVSIDDWYGQPIVEARRIPVTAFDDLLCAVQQLRARQFSENRRSGWTGQATADRRAAARERWLARGADPDEFRQRLRAEYAEAARLHEAAAGPFDSLA